jgi:hypothetical protein
MPTHLMASSGQILGRLPEIREHCLLQLLRSDCGTRQNISAAQQLRPVSWGTTDPPNASMPCPHMTRLRHSRSRHCVRVRAVTTPSTSQPLPSPRHRLDVAERSRRYPTCSGDCDRTRQKSAAQDPPSFRSDGNEFCYEGPTTDSAAQSWRPTPGCSRRTSHRRGRSQANRSFRRPPPYRSRFAHRFQYAVFRS